MALMLHADACRSAGLVGWLVLRDLPNYPGKIIARLVTDAPTPYVLVADTLAEVHAALPPGLVRSEHLFSDLMTGVEFWLARDIVLLPRRVGRWQKWTWRGRRWVLLLKGT
jgi:hypothetical protein